MKKAEKRVLSILYEDEAVIALDKPSGLLVAPDRWDKNADNLMRRVHEQLSPAYFNAHRLDRDTSGVVVCAKTATALKYLTGLFDSREVQKRYLALTRPGPREDGGVIQAALVPDETQPGRMCVSRRGKESETAFEVLERWRGEVTLLRLEPRTGRTHQIRVHLAHQGWPILGDRLYGNGQGLFLSELKEDYKYAADPESPLMGRLALHAESITFRHPLTREDLTICTPLPGDFERALKYLRRYASMESNE